MIAGWLLVNLAQLFHVNALFVQRSMDGGLGHSRGFSSNEFLFEFGWLLGPLYLVPWMFLNCVVVFMRWWVTGK